MKKILALLGMMLPFVARAETMQLPKPELTGGVPLMEAITNRKTVREFSAKKIDEQDLSNILFAAWGFSHDGKRTIPTARNKQDMGLYAFVNERIWRYDAAEHKLEKVSDENIVDALATQDFVKEAPLTLIFTGPDDSNNYTAMHAGSAYQNVGLYCASRGLNNVVRGWFDHDAVAKALGLKPEEVVITQTIGWPYM